LSSGFVPDQISSKYSELKLLVLFIEEQEAYFLLAANKAWSINPKNFIPDQEIDRMVY
jgi:hypothetical protein